MNTTAPTRAAGRPGADVSASVLSVRGLVKAFAGAPAVLDGLSFEVRAGESVGVIGANGTGKSTLLRCIVRLAEADAGSIRLFDTDISALSGRALARTRARVGFVFQRHNLVSRLSALSNVIHGTQARRHGPSTWHQSLARRSDREEALACLAAVGLADKAGQRVDSLSGGQSQRVAIARVLMQRPEIVLADEPDASLDPKAGEEVMGLLAQLARDNGIALVFVSHQMAHAAHFADRVLGLAGGRVALDRPARDTNASELARFFVGPGNPLEIAAE
jgi:phosphonate transport system ATP-binding protein